MDTFPTLPTTQELSFFVYSLYLYSAFAQACRSLILAVTAMTIMLIFSTFLFSIKRPKPHIDQMHLKSSLVTAAFSALIRN